MTGSAVTRVLALTTLLGLVTACATEPPARTALPAPPPAQEPTIEELREQRSAALQSLTDWQVKGKVAYRLPDDAGSASVDWQQRGEQSRLRLSGPLGVGSTQVSNEGALLRVRRDGIDRLYPADAAPWLPNGVLLPIPMNSIQYWLRGMPDPTLELEALEAEAITPDLIQQAGWIIRYEEYREVSGLAMPRRLTLVAPDNALTLRVILRQWRWE